MCAKKHHEVPPYQAVQAGVMRKWLESRVLGAQCEAVGFYAFAGQPMLMSGRRRTEYPFMKYFLGGAAQIQRENGEVAVVARPGTLAAFAAGSYANVEFAKPVEFFRVTLLPEETFLAFHKIMRVCPGDTGPRDEWIGAYVLTGAPSRLVRELWDRLERWPGIVERAEVWRVLVREWCVALARAEVAPMSRDGTRRRARRTEVMQYLEAHAHQLINRQTVAEALGMSLGEVSRLFGRGSPDGGGFTETLNRMRLEHAKEWLRQVGVTVSEVAARCGFSSANYFAQVFRRTEGMGPQAWRERMCDGMPRKRAG